MKLGIQSVGFMKERLHIDEEIEKECVRRAKSLRDSLFEEAGVAKKSSIAKLMYIKTE